MLSQEWHELEMLGDRVTQMRDRYGAAQQANNAGLIQSLKHDLQVASRQREQLLTHISARLGSAAA